VLCSLLQDRDALCSCQIVGDLTRRRDGALRKGRWSRRVSGGALVERPDVCAAPVALAPSHSDQTGSSLSSTLGASDLHVNVMLCGSCMPVVAFVARVDEGWPRPVQVPALVGCQICHVPLCDGRGARYLGYDQHLFVVPAFNMQQGGLHRGCVVPPAVLAKPCCHDSVCGGCSTHAGACNAPPSGVLLFVWVCLCYGCSPRPLPLLSCCVVFCWFASHLGAVVGSSPLWSVCRFCWRVSGSLLGKGKALGMTQPGL
jgi:hypothetical protein